VTLGSGPTQNQLIAADEESYAGALRQQMGAKMNRCLFSEFISLTWGF